VVERQAALGGVEGAERVVALGAGQQAVAEADELVDDVRGRADGWRRT
jgi:hypothetical protein